LQAALEAATASLKKDNFNYLPVIRDVLKSLNVRLSSLRFFIVVDL
jgi:hypothetical protein